MGTIRTLVLSGGGGRGAFHAGVYQYLSQRHKAGVDWDHRGAWEPEIVVGTSIGAINGAAIVQGIPAEDLVAFWRSLHEHDIQGLPPGMTPIARWIANRVLKTIIGVPLPAVDRRDSTALPPRQSWNPLPGLGVLGEKMFGRWSSLLDTGPLRGTITHRLGLDEELIAASPKTLLINATNVSTGQRVTFSNHAVYQRGTRQQRCDVIPGVTIQRILASCSIPLVYPWTYDGQTRSAYWDGAVVANTPLGVALDAASPRPSEDAMEVVIVLMTPWRTMEMPEASPSALPQDFSEAVSWALDWALLASFRERLDLIAAYNRLRQLGIETGDPLLSSIREVRPVIVAPDGFFPAARILDYDERSSALIKAGYEAAEKAFANHFPDGVSAGEMEVMQREVECAG